MDNYSNHMLPAMYFVCFAGLCRAFRLAGQSPKLTYNLVSAVFTTSVIATLSGILVEDNPSHHTDQYRYFVSLTTGYFAYDLIYIVFCLKKSLFHLALMYHHLAAIMIVNVDPLQYYGYIIIFVGEVSNLVSFPIYHLIQFKDTLAPSGIAWLARLKTLQLVWYGIWRVVVFTGLVVKLYMFTPPGDYGLWPYNALIPVYVMGLVWTVKLWQGVYLTTTNPI